MPRSWEQNKLIKDERREQILAAALKLFASKGFAAVRISDISNSTGISQGLIYHYYKSKEEIFNSLIDSAMDKINQAAINLEKLDFPAAVKIKIAIEGLLDGFRNHAGTTDYYFLITQAALSESFPAEAKKIILEKNGIKYEVIRRIIEEGQGDGTIKKYDPAEMTTLFFSTINGLALNNAINGPEARLPKNELIIGMFLEDK